MINQNSAMIVPTPSSSRRNRLMILNVLITASDQFGSI
jgi:hypothetical protein